MKQQMSSRGNYKFLISGDANGNAYYEETGIKKKTPVKRQQKKPVIKIK
ncbi:MAG: hypothetical protein V3U15_05915 [Nitrospinota bacterium]